jgi:hypothetical protein
MTTAGTGLWVKDAHADLTQPLSIAVLAALKPYLSPAGRPLGGDFDTYVIRAGSMQKRGVPAPFADHVGDPRRRTCADEGDLRRPTGWVRGAQMSGAAEGPPDEC